MGEFFRANAGAMIVDRQGRVLACQRASTKISSWQMPQGGLDAGEDALDAAYREVEEETGIPKSKLELLAVAPRWLSYELPPELRSDKTGRGQTQRWHLFRFLGVDEDIRLDPRELRAFQWMDAKVLVAQVVEFRRPIYAELLAVFGAQLASLGSPSSGA
jgi:putative (di)nucleoside polyphosphate hydrolase